MVESRVVRKATLSPSKISTFLACPIKFRWTYVDGRGKWYLRSKSYYSFGSTLHNVLQKFHDANGQGVKTEEEVLAAYDESWIDAGFSSAEEMAEAYGEGKVILQRHVEETRRRPLTSKTLFVEKQIRLDLGPFILIGRVDRVDEHEDGTLEIIDYKSGRDQVTAEEVSTDLAMNCYQLLLKSRFPDHPVIATIIALRTGYQAQSSMSEEALAEFRIDLLTLGETILHEEFELLVPSVKKLCKGCDFVPLCKRHPEFSDDLYIQFPD
jgi:putative RecB family exonuclease